MYVWNNWLLMFWSMNWLLNDDVWIMNCLSMNEKIQYYKCYRKNIIWLYVDLLINDNWIDELNDD